MDHPVLLLRRAERSRRQKVHPAPAVPPAAVPAKAPSRPVHTSSHASYTALMRSHDRVSTRHIAPGNGA